LSALRKENETMTRIDVSIRLLVLLLAAGSLLAASACKETCGDCRDEKCKDLVDYCVEDANCKCMSDCLGDKGMPGIDACLDKCGLEERPPAFVPLEQCVAVACPDKGDECSTPADYKPPEVEIPDAGVSDAGIGSGDLDDCAFDPDLAFDPKGEVLQLESADQSVCVRLERRNEGAGSLANTEYTLTDVWLGPLGEVAHVDDTSQLCYYSSHHNFKDWAHVWTGTRHHDIAIALDGHGGDRTYELHTAEAGPLDGSLPCPPLSDGVGPIGYPIPLFPINP
jgi:hypothetical protein